MPVLRGSVQAAAKPYDQYLILQPAALDEVIARPSSRRNSPVSRYIINMFRIDNSNSIRPRRVTRSVWGDSFQNKLNDGSGLFRIGDSHQKVDIPISVPHENEISNNVFQKGLLKSCYDNLEQYFANSSLHGLRYVGDTTISFGERLFWLCAFVCAVCFATFFIASIYTKYNLSPVIMSLNPIPTPVSSLPFPAITICNANQAKRSEADRILYTGTDLEKMLLDDYCNSNTSYINTSAVSDEGAKWDNVLKFILRVNPTCKEMLKVCIWKQHEQSCNELFNSGLTDEGLCCTFNSMPRDYIFRNPKDLSDLNVTIFDNVDDWTPERGYASNATDETIPRRAAGRGAHLGLTLVLDAAVNSYYCSSTSSVGFKILLHNPIETPKMADFGFLTPPGMESRIVITPTISDASEAIRNIDIDKRMCFFANERYLNFYRTYTERNCKLECQANYTLQQCGCVPFYLPKNKQKKICGKKQERCSNAAKEAMDTASENLTNCNCLPGCFELSFDSSPSYGKLTDSFRLKEGIIKNETAPYFMENMAVLHFYFMQSQFTGNTKSVLYGFSEFLSNTGGLLGLFLGFSFLSAVEIAYFLSLRIFCSFVRSRSKQHSSKKKSQPGNNQALVYPFAK